VATLQPRIIDIGSKFATSFASVVDTGGKFATCVNDTRGNLPLVSSTPVEKFATGINDNGSKFAKGVNNTGGKIWKQYQAAHSLK
jgi:hypothetical protein